MGLIFAEFEYEDIRIDGLISLHRPYRLAFRYVAGSIILVQVYRDSKFIITDEVFVSLEEEPDLEILATRWDNQKKFLAFILSIENSLASLVDIVYVRVPIEIDYIV